MQIGFSNFLENHSRDLGDTKIPAGVEQTQQYFQSIIPPLPSQYLPNARSTAPDDGAFILVENADEPDLVYAQENSLLGLIEIADTPQEVVKRIEIMTATDVIGISLSSKSASELNVVPVLCKTARSLFGMSASSVASMELAIQEAAINALAHGNLGLRSAYEETDDNLGNYYSLIREKARKGEFKNKRIDIWIWEKRNDVFAVIADQGTGYSSSERRMLSPSEATSSDRRKLGERRQSGRGLDIMRKFTVDCWVSATGTSVAMRFGK